ncbi:MAG TPA: F0F1 ATP synthase subunit epsilon [Candidatus Angelobacter sp.]|jgi:F-type H+-transporting ATPase subunit epsilon|nr:F0F1 ATP synthase subunit epsilon [Candidatus Angelobacter sp.]
MAETIQLEVVTPERQVVDEQAEYIEIPALTGYIGVLPGHAPLIAELAVGEINYRTGSAVKRLAVAWGFAEVLAHKVTILAETAERAEEIDVSRAEAAKQRAEDALRTAGVEGNPEAQAALQRAAARLEVAGKK